jgi:hypothetical protein
LLASIMQESLIYYHRAYRKITGSGWIFFLEFILTTIPLSIIILLIYPVITAQMSLFTYNFLLPYYSPDSIFLIEKTFILGNVSIVTVPGSYPSVLTCLLNFIVCLCMIFLLPKSKIGRNFAIIAVFWALINLTSVIFFSVIPYEFPYTVEDYSELYVKSEVSMWFFIPFILGIAFLPLPSSFIPKIGIIIFTAVYSIIFGTLRYIVFLFIVSNFSVLYMAILFFSFGPLIDFVYIVGIYSYYTYFLAKKLKGDDSIWKWLY